MIGLTVLLTVNPQRARAIDWGAAIEKALEELALSTQPEALKPIIEAAADADTFALGFLTTAAYAARIKLEAKNDDEPVPDYEKKLKALNAILALEEEKLSKKEPPHTEQGTDPSFGRFQAGGPISLPQAGGSVPLSMSLNTLTSPSPVSYFVLPPAVGSTQLDLQPTTGSIIGTIHNDSGSGSYRVELNDFSYTLPSFSLAGKETGINTISLSKDIGAPLGTIKTSGPTDTTGSFSLQFQATMKNDLYGTNGPVGPAIPVSLQATGVIDFSTGSAAIVSEGPFLIPGIPGVNPGASMFAAPTKTSFESNTNTLTFHDMFFDKNFELDDGLSPRIAFIRRSDGTYETSLLSTDKIMGAFLSIGSLHISSISDALVTFDPTTVTIMNGGITLLKSRLTNIFFNPQNGDFFGDVDFLSAGSFFNTGESPFLAEYLASNPRLQLLGPVAATDFFAATNHFTADGQSVRADYLNGESSVPVPEPGSVCFTGVAVLGILTFARHRARKLGMHRTKSLCI